MCRFYHFAFLCAATLFTAAGVQAEDQRSSVQIFAAHSIVRPGERLPVAVKITVADGWHTYAKEPGDSGMPPSIKISGADGLEVAEWRFPPPETFTDSIGTSYGYEHEVVLLSEVLVPETVTGTLELTASIKWMICKDTCVFMKDNLTLSVKTGAVSSGSSAEWKTLLEKSGWNDLKRTSP